MTDVAGADESFIGTPLKSFDAGGFSVAQWCSPFSDDEIRPHGHRHAHFMLYTAGVFFTEAHMGVSSPEAPLVFNPAQTYHRDRPVSGGGSFFTVTVFADRKAELASFDWPADPMVIRRPESRRLVHELVDRCAGRDAGTAEIESLCLELSASIEGSPRMESSRPRWIDRAVERLLEEAGEPRSITEVAALAEVDPAHFVRAFRRFVGCTPGDFHRLARLRSAAIRLTRTRLPIAEIALDAGFADQSHFTKSFGRWFGVSPAAYRRLTAS